MANCDILALFRKHAHRLIFFDLVDAKYEYQKEEMRLPNGKVEKAGSQNGTFMLGNRDYGDGEVPLQEIMRIIKTVKYKGWINIDHHYSRVSPRDSLTRCMKYIEEKLDRIYSWVRRIQSWSWRKTRAVCVVCKFIEPTVCHWENNRSKPGVSYMPAIIRFLGYDPQPPSETWAERLVQGRKTLGLTQSAAAVRIGVDQGTLARWERGEREPDGKFGVQARMFLSSVKAGSAPAVAQGA
jgi:DNA-binding XRE family transcriptional regulator